MRAFKSFVRHLRAGQRILDVGCGDRPFLRFLEHVEYIGIDFRPQDPSIIAHDLTTPLPFGDSEFDGIILSEVLEHIPNPFDLLSQVKRVAKPGAVVFLSTPFALPVHGSPFDFYRYTNFFYDRIFELFSWEKLEFSSSNSVLSTPFQISNQIVLGVPAPYFVKRMYWVLSNLLSLIFEQAVRLARKKTREKLFHAMPIGYNAIYRVLEAHSV